MDHNKLKQYLEYLELSGIQDIFVDKTGKEKSPEPEIDAKKLISLLNQKYANCNKCPLAETRNKFCYGNGDAQADLMLIGEGPGADEDRTGKVFVGRAGQLLTRMLKAINLSREEVYISNIVKCRPPQNRNPKKEEIEACLPYLNEQIDIIQPKLLLLLGRVAAVTLLNVETTLKSFRQQTHRYRDIKTYVTYHPSALLRNPNWKKFAWIDLKKLRDDYFALK